MSGLVQVLLSDNELGRLGKWHGAYVLAGENSALDDRLADRLERAYMAVACVPHVEGPACRVK